MKSFYRRCSDTGESYCGPTWTPGPVWTSLLTCPVELWDGMLGTEADGADVGLLSPEQLECKICYCSYNLAGRRPKVLRCRHCLCSRCLSKILDLDGPAGAVMCPFCRCVTVLTGATPNNLLDDCELLAALALQNRNQRSLHLYQQAQTELVLSPRRLSLLVSSSPPVASSSSSSSSSSAHSFVVITIMEPPPASHQNLQLQPQPRGPYVPGLDYRSSSLDSMASIHQRWTGWNCAARALVWVLALLYFSSLPLGVFLLVMQRTGLGAVLLSLVPSSLVLVLVYGLCRCVCHELWLCMN
ncbi:E3 ubiquitin-protein ligase RNF182 [Betta splendens]|uniref:E3 ubiquitin-protein ligase RNF182 n=1 Tax=Betta splendens TaxID=158456 RepID=A0A6P7KXL5_BETSP|nr:E3 ubiquitin-protein ligase RNF182 [Betta splendens]